jgi:hypothetical protein
MESEGSLPHSQVPTTCPYSENYRRLVRKTYKKKLIVTTVRGWKGDIIVAILKEIFLYVACAGLSRLHCRVVKGVMPVD